MQHRLRVAWLPVCGRRESGTKWGRLRRERHGVHCPAEAGVPAVKVAGELVVEGAAARIKERPGLRPGTVQVYGYVLTRHLQRLSNWVPFRDQRRVSGPHRAGTRP